MTPKLNPLDLIPTVEPGPDMDPVGLTAPGAQTLHRGAWHTITALADAPGLPGSPTQGARVLLTLDDGTEILTYRTTLRHCRPAAA